MRRDTAVEGTGDRPNIRAYGLPARSAFSLSETEQTRTRKLNMKGVESTKGLPHTTQEVRTTAKVAGNPSFNKASHSGVSGCSL